MSSPGPESLKVRTMAKTIEELKAERLQREIEKEKRTIEKREEGQGMDFCVNVSPEFRDWYYNLDDLPGCSLGMGVFEKRGYGHVIE